MFIKLIIILLMTYWVRQLINVHTKKQMFYLGVILLPLIILPKIYCFYISVLSIISFLIWIILPDCNNKKIFHEPFYIMTSAVLINIFFTLNAI